MIVLRIQSPEGTKRVDVEPTASTFNLFEKVFEAFNLNSFGFALYKNRNQNEEIVSTKSKRISDYRLKHGDILYFKPINGTVLFDQPSTSVQVNDYIHVDTVVVNTNNVTGSHEDDVDSILYKTDGKIPRKRDDKFCRHNSNGCCVHCSPLEPFDESYLKEQNIKHMSFHSYIRKLTSGVDRGKFLSLEDISCRIKIGCKDHPPWPRGICSKCQPNAVTLNRQTYRHIDNAMFENSDLVERFLDYWRSTGHQRIGFLYGTYELHPDVPLGIRARVTAIYEPPQESSRDMVRIITDDRKGVVDEIAKKLGLTCVGWIFTDLLSEDVAKGTVQHIRGIESHFLTAQECIMAGNFQNMHPNSCKYASSGSFGSKFATVCVTGDSSKQVHMEGYQVTGQCMALVRDDCLLPTKDAPELGYVRESSDKQYVPDVFYKEKDLYGNEVARAARPLPVEYLLVDVPCSTPRVPLATFTRPRDNYQSFPVEARPLSSQTQDLRALAIYLAQWTDNDFLEAMSDFHVLIYIATMDALPMLPHMDELLEAIRTRDSALAARWRQSGHWATVEQLIAASEHDTNMSGQLPSADDGPMWTCTHCTYHNAANRDICEICVLPRTM
ncbi:nuclear protein localization 4 isoform X2 [Arctopsyche grandis]|uniref:nuclear protein localization 4 isoform X2 n=1 Tax=Arctopsyche grandis TaxID=121162 RepID=UPI00406D82BE